MIIKGGIETDVHGTILFSKPGKNSKSLQNVSHVIDVEIDLLVGIAPIFVNYKRAPLKPILEKQFCLAVDMFKQIGFRENSGALDENPSFWRLFGKEGRGCPRLQGEKAPCEDSNTETEDESFMTHHGDKE
jgi:hypothetical protein